MMASATGCVSVSGSSCSDCGTPLSVRMKSSAVSSKTNSPLLVFTNAGTSTRLERTERAVTCEPADEGSLVCAPAGMAESKTKPEIALAIAESKHMRRSMGRRLANRIPLLRNNYDRHFESEAHRPRFLIKVNVGRGAVGSILRQRNAALPHGSSNRDRDDAPASVPRKYGHDAPSGHK